MILSPSTVKDRTSLQHAFVLKCACTCHVCEIHSGCCCSCQLERHHREASEPAVCAAGTTDTLCSYSSCLEYLSAVLLTFLVAVFDYKCVCLKVIKKKGPHTTNLMIRQLATNSYVLLAGRNLQF